LDALTQRVSLLGTKLTDEITALPAEHAVLKNKLTATKKTFKERFAKSEETLLALTAMF